MTKDDASARIAAYHAAREQDRQDWWDDFWFYVRMAAPLLGALAGLVGALVSLWAVTR